MPRLNVQLDAEQARIFKQAAKSYGLKLSQWVRLMLTAAARAELCKTEAKARNERKP